MINSIKIAAGVLFSIFFCFNPAHAQDIDRLIQKADAHFNGGEYETALKDYRRAADRLPKQPGAAPLFSDIVNNMAAAHMALGNMEAFRRHFVQARNLKQQIAAQRRASRSVGENLLVNGGFEDGLIFPWGTGHYERPDGKFRFGVWWNSNNARAFMKIDAAEKRTGEKSLRITNYSPHAPHVFTTLSQRISGLQPNTVYSVSFYARAADLPAGAVFFTVDAAWTKRAATLPAGPFDWREFSQTVNIGHNDYIDFRVIHQNAGTVWLDDIVIRRAESLQEADMFQQAESLMDAARYEASLSVYKRLENQYADSPGALARIRQGMGRIYTILGKYDDAFEKLNYAYDRGWKRMIAIDLAELYYLLGDYDTAETRFDEALERPKGDQGTESVILNRLSRCYLAQGRFADALKAQRRSYHILKHIEDKHGQSQSLNQFGVIYMAQKDYANARASFQEALVLAENLDDKPLASDILVHLAETALSINDAHATRNFAGKAIRAKEAIGNSQGLVRALHVLARLDAAAGRLEQARSTYRRAVTLIETLSEGASGVSREAKAAFLGQFSTVYREYVEVLLELYRKTGADECRQEAFTTAEQARSRIFTEMMAESRAMQSFVAMSRDPEFAGLLDKDRLLTARIHALAKQAGAADMAGNQARAADVRKELNAARQERQAVQDRLMKGYPRYADLKQPKPVRLADVQALLGPDEAAMGYFVTDRRTALWVLTRETARMALIPVTR